MARTVTEKTAKQVLEELDETLSTMDTYESRALWNILTALRGPDMNDLDGEIKYETTAIVRARALPKTAAADNLGVISLGATFRQEAKQVHITPAVEEAGWHFVTHIKRAVRALGEMGK